MRRPLKATTLWQAAISLLPFASSSSIHKTRDVTSHDISIVAGSIGPDSLSIEFQSSCSGCFVGTEDGLELELTVPKSHGGCEVDQPTLNGLSLNQVWSGNHAQGQGNFVSKLANGLGSREFYASWDTLCLDGRTSLLSVNIHKIVGQTEVSEPTGFTASYYGGSEPLVLRLSSQPVNLTNNDHDLVSSWLHPSEAQRLIITVPPEQIDPANPLEVEYQALEHLKLEIFELHKQLRHQEGKILHMLKSDFSACTGVRCLLQTAVRKVPDFTQLVASHFRHHPKPGTGHAQEHLNCSRANDIDTLSGIGAHGDAFLGTTNTPPFAPPAHPSHNDGRPPPLDDQHPPPDHPPPPPHGRLLPYPPPPPFVEHPHWPHPDHPPHPSPGRYNIAPHLHPGHGQHHRHHVVKGGILLVLVSLVAALTFCCVRHQTKRRSDTRRRADRAARREERENERAYRHAARKHKWLKWWNRYRRPASHSDYEEKRALILQQEDVLEGAMQDDINSLRRAHEIVGDLMRAEEGRARMYHEANLPPFRRVQAVGELEADVGSSNGPSLLPAYLAPPPTYEEELEGDITVVDGFSYTPSGSEETPDSSVVDCSPRLSFETGRTTLTKEPRD